MTQLLVQSLNWFQRVTILSALRVKILDKENAYISHSINLLNELLGKDSFHTVASATKVARFRMFSTRRRSDLVSTSRSSGSWVAIICFIITLSSEMADKNLLPLANWCREASENLLLPSIVLQHKCRVITTRLCGMKCMQDGLPNL